MIIRRSIVLTLIAACAGTSLPCQAAEWGTLKGKFVLKGTPPEVKPLNVDKDEFCIKSKPKNQSLVLGKKNELANVIVYLKPPRGKTVEVHPDYAEKMKETVTLDNKNCEFVPHVTLLRADQPFVIANSDPTGHNTNATLIKNGQFNVLIAANQKREMKLSKEESIPLPVQCNIHAFMKGYIVVKADPYMATSGDDGTFEIKNIPAGTHEFVFWHERKGYLGNVKFEGGKTSSRGRVDLEIPVGKEMDLGTIEVPASLLK